MKHETHPRPYYIKILNSEFQKRTKINRRFSRRAFARKLEIDSSYLSKILHLEKIPSFTLAQKITNALSLSAEKRNNFIVSLAKTSVQNNKKVHHQLKSVLDEDINLGVQTRQIEEQQIAVVSEWYYFAIIQMTYLMGFKNDPAWVGGRLGISIKTAEKAIKEMLQLKLLRQNSQGKLEATAGKFEMSDGAKTSIHRRKRQRQILQKSLASLDEVDIKKRRHLAGTIAINPKDLDKVEKLMRKSMNQIVKALTESEPTHVYELCFNIFPLEAEV